MPQDIQPNKFKFTLNIRGVLTEVLLNSPEEWEKTTVKYGRSATYFGLVRSLTAPMRFILRGAGLLRQEFYQYGIVANVKILIDKLNPSTWGYKQIYKGQADFSKFEDDLKTASVTSTEDNLAVAIKGFDDVDYQIAVDVPEALSVTLPAINLREKADFIFTPSQQDQQPGYMALQLVNNKQQSITPSVQQQGYETKPSPNFTTDNNWFFQAQTDTTIIIDIDKLTGFVQALLTTPNRFRLQIVKNDGTVLANVYDITQSSAGGTPYDITAKYSFDLLAGERLFMYERLDGSTSSSTGFNVTGGILSLTYNTSSPATVCKALKASYVFDKLVQLMNGADTGGAYTPYPTQSFLLTSGELKTLAITCSNSIRKIDNGTQYQPGEQLSYGSKYQVVNGAVIYNATAYDVGDTFTAIQGVLSFTTSADGSVILVSFSEYLVYSFKDFFQDIYSLMGGNCSFGLDQERACLEDLAYVYRPIDILNLGSDRTNVKITPAIDLMYNSIKVGYNDQQYDSLNGYQEVNSEQTYRVLIPAPQKELNLISKTRADCMGIEQIRTTPVDTAASRSDNDNFFLWLTDDLSKPVTNEGVTYISGVDPNFYNWNLSPKHNLLRGGPFLRSIFDKLDGYEIIFTSALKNFNLVVVEGGIRVAESDNVLISNLPSPIFLPYYIDLTTDLAFNALDLFDSTPFGRVSFQFNDTTIRGFIQECSVDAGQNSSRDFKLLMSPDNNLLNLIR